MKPRPAALTSRVKHKGKKHHDKDEPNLNDEEYRRFINDYAEDLREGIAYMLGDHPRED